MPEGFTIDSFFILQQSFRVFPIDKFNLLSISSLDINSRFFTDVNHYIIQIFIRDAIRYAW